MSTTVDATHANLTLRDKWILETHIPSAYFIAALRNGVAYAPGILPVLFLSFCAARNTGLLEQYKYSVVLLTFGGWLLSLPVAIWNYVVAAITSAERGKDSFTLSVWACSLLKSGPEALMNCSVGIGLIIAINRYLLLHRRIELRRRSIAAIFGVITMPNFLYLAHLIFFGVIKSNDCCAVMMSTPDNAITYVYFGYLLIVTYSTIAVNLRTLLFMATHKRRQRENGTQKLGGSEQWQLTLGLVVQSFAPAVSYTSYFVFMTMFMSGIQTPPIFDTITNGLNCLSTFINPIASMVFVKVFRNEFENLVRCRFKKDSFFGSTRS